MLMGVGVHTPPPSCVMLMTCPPTTICAVRCGPLLLGMEKFIVPFPAPVDPDVIVMKLSLDTAVQLQLPDAVTFTLPVPPAFVKSCVEELSDVTQVPASKKEAIPG